MEISNDPKGPFGAPLRQSLRTWVRIEAARRGVRIQDLLEEIVDKAKTEAEA